jgi:bisphosphoglycerate-dependent phosphoglycerate mutase
MTGKLRRHKVDHLGFTSAAERIIEYLQGDSDRLTTKEQEKLERITLAKSLLLQHKFASKVVKMLQRTYNYSEITAYRDLKLMERVYGPLLKMNKDLKRAIAEEMIKQDRELAITQKDSKAMAQSTRNFIQLHQLDKEEAELPDLSYFNFQPIIMAVLPEQVGQNPPDDNELLQKVDAWWKGQSEDAEEVEDE